MQFEMGPPMSTYLLAVTVGRVKGVTQQSASGTNITMWAVPGLQSQLGVALQVRFVGHVLEGQVWQVGSALADRRGEV